MVELIFDGNSDLAPCFYHPPDPPADSADVPDSDLVPPSEIPGNDQRNLDLLAQMYLVPPAKLSTPCMTNPAGFVCTPLPALPGQLVTCVPRMDQSDLNQLSAKVLPLTVSRSNGSLDDPARGDPRFEFFPNKYLPAFSRCCAQTGLSAPSSVVPKSCGAPGMHHVAGQDLGYRNNPQQISQLAVTHSQLKKEFQKNWPQSDARAKIWDHEAAQIVPGMYAKFKMMTLPPVAVVRKKYWLDFF